jgi:hypothetical protein
MYSYKAFGLSISSEIELPELSRSDAVKLPDVAIKIGHVSLPKLKGVPIQRRGIQAEFGVDSNENLVLHWNDVADFMAVDGNLLIVSPLTGDENLLSLFTVSEALGLILFQRGYFLLHASSVKVGDEAWCFMGNPGAGKSTTAAAFIKAGCELLSDDLTAIDFDANGVARIIPAYPQLKIWDNTVTGLQYDKNSLQPVSEGVNKYSFQPVNGFDHDPVRLGAVYFIHKAKNQAVQRALTPAEIPIQTIKNFPLPIELLKGDNLKRHFAQSFRCAAGASLWKMRRPDGFANLEKWVQASISLFPSRQ